jgi:hypothetical protein
MNPGYLSFVLITILFILLASGWKDILFRGLSQTSILLFFIGWFAAGWFDVSAGGVNLRLTAPFLLLLAIWGTWKLDTLGQMGHVWMAGCMLGLLDLLMQELNGWNLAFAQALPAIGPVLALVLLTLVTGRHWLWQFIAITVGLLAAECVHAWLHRHSMPGLIIGGPVFSDHWWYVFGVCRGLTVAAEQSVRAGANAVRRYTGHWKQGED